MSARSIRTGKWRRLLSTVRPRLGLAMLVILAGMCLSQGGSVPGSSQSLAQAGALPSLPPSTPTPNGSPTAGPVQKPPPGTAPPAKYAGPVSPGSCPVPGFTTTSYATGHGPHAVAVADLNHDG